MGFLDHLFKLRQSDEKMGEGKGEIPGSGENAGPPPDPGVFLHPKDFGPRGAAALYAPLRSAAPGAKTPPPRTRANEIVITLGDVLPRIPTQLLRAGLHDANRELRLPVGDLSSDVARRHAAVPLSKIAARCPDVFSREITAADDTEIRLPLQKLLEQFGLLHARDATPPATRSATLSPPESSAHDAPSPAPPAPDIAPLPAAQPTVAPAPAVEPAAHVHAAPAPPIIAEAAATTPSEDFVPPPAPTLAEAAPVSSMLIHPPPIVRPVLAHPPTLLAAETRQPEPQVSREAPAAPASEPPARFPQEALQSLFMTDEVLDLAAVCRLAGALPGVRACALEWRGDSAIAGDPPAGFDLAALRAAAARLNAVGPLPIGALENCTLHGGQGAVSIFAHPGVLLGALHRPLPPGVRERLAALAAELARP